MLTPAMRNHEPIEVAVPASRRVVGCVVALAAIALLVGVLPFAPVPVAVIALLIALGLLL